MLQNRQYKPYVSESESGSESDSESTDGGNTTGTESGSGTATDSETETDTDTDGIEGFRTNDDRMRALDTWRKEAQNWIKAPESAKAIDTRKQGPALKPAPGSSRSLGLYTPAPPATNLKPHHCVLMLDSRDRDSISYPFPTQFNLKTPREYRNISQIELVQIKFFNGIYSFSGTRTLPSGLIGNTYLRIQEYTDISSCWIPAPSPSSFKFPYKYVDVRIPDGTYTIQQLIDTLTETLNATAFCTNKFAVGYNCTTGRISIYSDHFFRINWYWSIFRSLPPSTAFDESKLSTLQYQEWGLGWNLGFGGKPDEYEAVQNPASTILNPSGDYVITATYAPRLFPDYIYLSINKFGKGNSADNTYIENHQKSLRSTGNVDAYFGKLLLSPFGCYAQTFIQSPKIFIPARGKLDTLYFEWYDRHGTLLTGNDILSCDWHATLRITEMVDRTDTTSTLITAATAAAAKK